MRNSAILALAAMVLLGCAGGNAGAGSNDDVATDVSPDAPADAAADTAAVDADADAAAVDGSGTDTGTATDVDLGDGRPDDVDVAVPDADGPDDADVADTAVECPDPFSFDYTCDAAEPATCPGGFCLFGGCIAPIVNQDRWADCGDKVCTSCESVTTCPVDCVRGATNPRRDFNPATTITVTVHGFNVVGGGEFEAETYGRPRGPGGEGELVEMFSFDSPNGVDFPEAPNQMVGVEYYGALPADWLTDEQIAEIESYDWRSVDALHRYALIVAMFIRDRLERSGATSVNLLCHSMGCHVTRYMIENDIEGLASEGRFSRWYTTAGVIRGARLARLFDNPTVRDVAELINLNTSDFIHMNPDVVADRSARWDHDISRADNPMFAGMLIHHTCGSDPRVSETADLVRLLDLNNPDNDPNDGIVFTDDEYFADQDEERRFVAADGTTLRPTRSYQPLDHFEITDAYATGILGAAHLYGTRNVVVTLDNIRLKDDLERDSVLDFGQYGDPPAELTVEGVISYDPFVSDTFGYPGIVQEVRRDMFRTPGMWRQTQGTTLSDIDPIVFEGPLLQGMTTIRLDVELLEVDSYPRFNVFELSFDSDDTLIGINRDVDLVDQTIHLENDKVAVDLVVDVIERF